MSKTIEQRDGKGRFQTGHKAAGPGRPVGARSKLGQAFLEDLRDIWQEHGVTALRRAALEDPSRFIATVASLLPKQLDVAVEHGIDPQAVLTSFRTAVASLQADAPPPLKVIDGKRV
ncbi:hypothetical protein IVB27_38520 [Bradyrhizobium sp. 197]|uniref:hypothetical protein n=1 Tax=Bradyrhizobium sp. 197 TaxID=2782663 RepID=UPI001FF90445|nr:hypothetical protein [Bradyrhizobium sp. 197]MCK1480474.1 hypothetical protein [Bradyrhizobium sp. 197]